MALWPNQRKEQENLEEVCVGGGGTIIGKGYGMILEEN